MACAIISGRTLDCRDSVGGIKDIYWTELANKATLTETSGAITAFTLSTGKQFWKYEMVKETANEEETIANSEENGTLYFDQALNIIFNKQETATRNQILLAAKNQLLVIVTDRNGKHWLLGRNNGMVLGGKGMTGKAMADRNGYELSFIGKEELPKCELSDAILATLIVPAS